ncbi:hypothetical protein H920_07384 [Fukomys damarensis]|uniref:Uncharacterized protein n=1 Tax=Fukomys damarensis TaxID=885580 RepID=A0A091DL86_FUKDA|nr:hypothetical protein H920_07384 [Fukomys damarensis]
MPCLSGPFTSQAHAAGREPAIRTEIPDHFLKTLCFLKGRAAFFLSLKKKGRCLQLKGQDICIPALSTGPDAPQMLIEWNGGLVQLLSAYPAVQSEEEGAEQSFPTCVLVTNNSNRTKTSTLQERISPAERHQHQACLDLSAVEC